MDLRTLCATFSVGLVNGVSRRLGRGSGTVAGGRVGLKIHAGLVGQLCEGKSVALVSGTNGKTTTTALLTAAMSTGGKVVASNVTGSNMPAGHAAALAARRRAPIAVLETDEGYLGRTIEEAKPDVILLLNLSRDQLDRMSEVRMLAQRWSEALSRSSATVVANADDPLVVMAARDAGKIVWVAGGLVWKDDATGCPLCQGPIVFGENNSWRCAECSFARPTPSWSLNEDMVVSPDGTVGLMLRLPGAFNRSNALMAMAGAHVLGVGLQEAADALASVSDVAGRFHQSEKDGIVTRMMLAKNPAGWVALLDLVATNPAPLVIGINARTADGTDPSWLFDVPFSLLSGRTVIATGDRWRDLSVRLRYAEVPHLVDGDLGHALVRAQQEAHGSVDFIGNYTCFQDALKATP